MFGYKTEQNDKPTHNPTTKSGKSNRRHYAKTSKDAPITHWSQSEKSDTSVLVLARTSIPQNENSF